MLAGLALHIRYCINACDLYMYENIFSGASYSLTVLLRTVCSVVMQYFDVVRDFGYKFYPFTYFVVGNLVSLC